MQLTTCQVQYEAAVCKAQATGTRLESNPLHMRIITCIHISLCAYHLMHALPITLPIKGADSWMPAVWCAHPFPAACHMSTRQNTTAFLTSGRECWKAANSPGSSWAGATASRSACGICRHTSCSCQCSRQRAKVVSAVTAMVKGDNQEMEPFVHFLADAVLPAAMRKYMLKSMRGPDALLVPLTSHAVPLNSGCQPACCTLK